MKNFISDKKEAKKEEMRAWCHLCEPPQGFLTIDELQQHTVDKHRVFKG